MRRIFVFVLLAALSGCASIDVVPLTPNGSEDRSQEHGIRYFLPKPYLLVTELPMVGPGDQGAPAAAGGAGKGGGKDDSSKGDGGGGKDSSAQASTPSAPSSDTSFSAATTQYAVKLIYLPDLGRPMALKVNSGLFGTSSVAPTLTDGWMLTSLNGSSDSGAAATLQALTGLISGGASGGKNGGGKSGGDKNAAGGGPPPIFLPPWGESVLPPGLYEIHFDVGRSVDGLKPLVYFCKNGPSLPLPETQQLVNGRQSESRVQPTPCRHE